MVVDILLDAALRFEEVGAVEVVGAAKDVEPDVVGAPKCVVPELDGAEKDVDGAGLEASGAAKDDGWLEPDVGGAAKDDGGAEPDVGGAVKVFNGVEPDVACSAKGVNGAEPDVGCVGVELESSLVGANGVCFVSLVAGGAYVLAGLELTGGAVVVGVTGAGFVIASSAEESTDESGAIHDCAPLDAGAASEG